MNYSQITFYILVIAVIAIAIYIVITNTNKKSTDEPFVVENNSIFINNSEKKQIESLLRPKFQQILDIPNINDKLDKNKLNLLGLGALFSDQYSFIRATKNGNLLTALYNLSDAVKAKDITILTTKTYNTFISILIDLSQYSYRYFINIFRKYGISEDEINNFINNQLAQQLNIFILNTPNPPNNLFNRLPPGLTTVIQFYIPNVSDLLVQDIYKFILILANQNNNQWPNTINRLISEIRSSTKEWVTQIRDAQTAQNVDNDLANAFNDGKQAINQFVNQIFG
jgi:hypothetical protein